MTSPIPSADPRAAVLAVREEVGKIVVGQEGTDEITAPRLGLCVPI